MRIALTIAGSDSVAGAGVQGDLKTFAALGVYGISAVTAITSQSTTGVSDIFSLPSDVVRSQIEQVAQDVEISAVKTGMLATAAIVQVVAEMVHGMRQPNLVVDPVLAATGGRTLLAPEGVSTLKARLLPLARVVTPNVAEATALSGVRVDSLSTAREAAKRILDLGPRAVIVKGGHLAGAQAIDVLYYQGAFIEFPALRASIGAVHGTGCAFASAVAAGLALGDDIPAAVLRAKQYVTGAIDRSVAIGHGSRALDHFWDRPSPRGLY